MNILCYLADQYRVTLSTTVLVFGFAFCVLASADASNGQLPSSFIGWYAPASSAADHCVKPENWDDNYSVSPRFVRLTDGQGDFATIGAAKPDTANIQVVYRVGTYEGDPHPRILRQSEVWHLQDVDGKVLLTRTVMAVRSTPPSRQDTQGLPATLPAMRKCL
jgi:hypothetical protein